MTHINNTPFARVPRPWFSALNVSKKGRPISQLMKAVGGWGADGMLLDPNTNVHKLSWQDSFASLSYEVSLSSEDGLPKDLDQSIFVPGTALEVDLSKIIAFPWEDVLTSSYIAATLTKLAGPEKGSFSDKVADAGFFVVNYLGQGLGLYDFARTFKDYWGQKRQLEVINEALQTDPLDDAAKAKIEQRIATCKSQLEKIAKKKGNLGAKFWVKWQELLLLQIRLKPEDFLNEIEILKQDREELEKALGKAKGSSQLKSSVIALDLSQKALDSFAQTAGVVPFIGAALKVISLKKSLEGFHGSVSALNHLKANERKSNAHLLELRREAREDQSLSSLAQACLEVSDAYFNHTKSLKGADVLLKRIGLMSSGTGLVAIAIKILLILGVTGSVLATFATGFGLAALGLALAGLLIKYVITAYRNRKHLALKIEDVGLAIKNAGGRLLSSDHLFAIHKRRKEISLILKKDALTKKVSGVGLEALRKLGDELVKQKDLRSSEELLSLAKKVVTACTGEEGKFLNGLKLNLEHEPAAQGELFQRTLASLLAQLT